MRVVVAAFELFPMKLTKHKTQSTKLMPPRRRRVMVLAHLVLCILCFEICAFGAPVSFSRDLAPILADKCLTCHHEKKAKGRYRVDTFEQLFKAGEGGD